MASTHKRPRGRRQRFSPLLWTASLGAMAVMALGITGTLAQLAATITNPTNEVTTAAATAFGFTEALVTPGPGGTAAAPCATATSGTTDSCALNKYGAAGAGATPILPGDTRTTTVRLAHTAAAGTPGAVPGTLSLGVAACGPLPGSAALCAAATVVIACTAPGTPGAPPLTTVVPAGTTLAAAAGTYTIGTVAAGESVDCEFTVTQPSAAAGVQDLTVTQPMTWTFTPTV